MIDSLSPSLKRVTSRFMHPDSGPAELELRDYLRVLQRRKAIIALSVLVIVAAALVASFLQTPVYQGTAELLLQQRVNENPFDPVTGQRNDPTRSVQTEIQVMKSRPVREAVVKKLGAAPPVSAAPVGQTDVVQVRAQSRFARQAAAIANAYANAYIEFRRKQAVNDLLDAGKEVQAKVDDYQHQIDGINDQIAKAPPDRQAAVEADVNPQRQSLLSQQALFRQKLDQLEVSAALRSGGAQLVTPATTPSSPIKPTPKRNAVLAFAVGLIFGVGLAFLLEYLDDSVKTKDDLDRVVKGLPTLGMIPAIGAWKDRDVPQVVSISEPSSPTAEAYRALRTSVQFLGLQQPVRVIQLTSPNPSEGKTTTLSNLAVALARAGQRVVVCCADLRKPRVHDFFGLPNVVGFTSVLLGDVPLSGALQEVPGVERVSLLASGPIPPNPSELLSSARAAEVIAALQAEFDVVLIDTPPVLPVTDAAVLSARVDATILVATANSTTRRELTHAIDVLRQVEAPLVGVVFNGVPTEAGYGYGYGHSYATEAAAPNGRRRLRQAVGRKS